MTVQVSVGRRIPRSWFRRTASTTKGLITFQENIWYIIKQSLSMAKRKANASGKIKFVITNDREIEDLNYEIEWIKVMIQGNEAQEKEEYDEAMGMYQPLGKLFKKDIPPADDRMKSFFKSKILSSTKVKEAYDKGYGATQDKNIANKLLEMGILTHIELIKDYDTRVDEIRPDF